MIQQIMSAFVALLSFLAFYSAYLIYLNTQEIFSRGVIGSAVFGLILLIGGVMGLMPSGGH